MKILGFSSGGVGHEGNVDRMVKAIIEKSDGEGEFVKLTELNYSGCKGCVQLCAKPQVCRLDDDLLPYYQKIKDADAVVVGSPVYFNTLNGAAASFIERFFGYRHVTSAIKGKPFVLVVCGSMRTTATAKECRRRLQKFWVNILGVLEYVSSSPPCLSCGRHRECHIGGLYKIRGKLACSLAITPDLFHRWEHDTDTVKAVEVIAGKLREL